MSSLPTYMYSDGTTITFKELGPKKAAIITYGETLTDSSGNIIFTKGSTREGNYSFSGTIDDLASEMIIDYNNSLITYGQTPVKLSSTTPNQLQAISKQDGPPISDAKGEINLSTLNLPQFLINPEDVQIIFQSEGYQNFKINPYTKSGNLKTLPVIELIPNEIALDEEIAKTNELSDKQVDELLKSKKTPEWFAQQRLSKITINKIQKILVPLILTQIIGKFGVSDPMDLIEKIKETKEKGQSIVENNKDLIPKEKEKRNNYLKTTAKAGVGAGAAAGVAMGKDKVQQEVMNLIQQNIGSKSFCPSQENIEKIIQIKNKTTTQLNQVMKLINSNTKILGFNANLIDLSTVIFQLLKFSPIPIPPGAPVSLVGLIEDQKEFLDKDIIKKLGSITSGTLAILLVARQTLTQVLELMGLLDELIQFCSPEEVTYDQKLNQELRDLSNEQSRSNREFSPTTVNGFKMEMETETTEKPLKRKRAIARDTSGVVVLKGDWSFSSIDQILIDELSFYIQQNNLKSE
jgi:hypothetical protein